MSEKWEKVVDSVNKVEVHCCINYISANCQKSFHLSIYFEFSHTVLDPSYGGGYFLEHSDTR